MRLRTLSGIALTAFLAASAAQAQEKKLSVGDPAPGLDIEKWVQGEETSITEGRVYVVEFWATWCIPCRKSIPHLNELYKQYVDDGLTIIGVSNEEVGTVEPFVRMNRDHMTYTVAVDRREATTRAWMNAAGQDGIPCAFIVDRKGKIQFIGHPLDEEFAEVLPLVMDDRYDAKAMKKALPAIVAAKNARKVQNWRMATRYYEEVITQDPHVFAPYALDLFHMRLVEMGQPTEAYAYARTLLDEYGGDSGLLASLARKIVTDPRIDNSQRDLEVAMLAADKAAASAREGDPKAYTVQALVHFKAGRFDKAVELQRRAYFVARPTLKPELKRVLDEYQEAARKAHG